MSQTVVVNLGYGNLNQGFPQITVRFWTELYPQAEQFVGNLPPAPELVESYRTWQLTYRALCDRLVLRQSPEATAEDELEIEPGGITQVSQLSFAEFSQQFQYQINTWLKSEGWLTIERQLRSLLNPTDEIRVIFEANDDLLRRFPWHCWGFFQDYPNAEMALSRPEYKRRESLRSQDRRRNVRILAVLGDRQGIDFETEQQALQGLTDAVVELLVTPSRQEFNQKLWDTCGWDILFFAGHSQTEGETGRIYINDNPINNSLTISQLEAALHRAIDQGLKLTIFNSCDGVGLAEALGKLHIPQVIVMREPVPNRVAQEFFQHFLDAFAHKRLPLYQAMRQARRKLQALEDEFPGASWLPVICQNPSVTPSTWLQLGGKPPCPYRGLFAFQETDADLFFGREQVTRDLIEAVNQKALVAVIGASGGGKSSVVFAGLVPRLRNRQSIHWQVISFRPGIKPFEALAEAFVELLNQTDDRPFRLQVLELEVNFQQDQQALCKTLERLHQKNPGSRLLLIVDQFEELYTLCPEAERQLFLDSLLNAVATAPAFTLLLTLRADFYGYALSDRRLSDSLQGSVYNLGPMSRQELERAIAQPAAQMQVKLESGLTDKLIQATWGQAGRLPLLEFALTELWSQQQAGWLTHQAYDAIGGVEEALANHAERVYAQLPLIDQQRVQRIFVQLVEPGSGTDSSRRLATRDEVGDTNWNLVSHLASARLVVTNRNEVTGEETVEVVHEALIRHWGRLTSWLQTDSEFRHWQEELRRARRQWEKSDREEEALLRGKLLSDAEYWYSNRREELSNREQQFIQFSLKSRDRRLEQQKRQRQLIFSGLLTGLFCALLLAGIAGWQSQRSAWSEARALLTASESLFTSDRKLDALVEALRGWKRLHQLLWVDQESRTQAQLVLQQAIFGADEQNRLSGHTDVVYDAAFSPDGQLIATASSDTTVKLWQPDGSLVKTLSGHQSGVYRVQISPDSQTIATGATDGTVKLWQRDGSLQTTFQAGTASLRGVTFSPDGQRVATASMDGTMKLWTRNGRLLKDMKAHPEGVNDVAFRPDNRLIATAGMDGAIQFWQPDGTLSHRFTGHAGAIYRIAFSPNGQLLASAGADRTVKLWTADGKLIKTFSGHSDRIFGVAISPDNQMIAAASADGTVKVWGRDGTLIHTFTGRNGELWSVAFSPDGQTIASTSSSGAVQLWHQENPLLTTLQGHSGRVSSVALSSNNQMIASAGQDKTVILWHRNGNRFKTLNSHEAEVRDIKFSPNSQFIASASDDRTIRVWHLRSDKTHTLLRHQGIVYSVAFSPDGQLIASGGAMGRLILWQPDGTQLKSIRAHGSDIWGIAFSPDGKIIASASRDNTIKLWTQAGVLIKTLTGHRAAVSAVAFSPDGQHIASASWDKTIKLWRRDGPLLKTLNGHNAQVQTIAFSPDGQLIASGSSDQLVKLWQRDGTLLNSLKGHNGAVFSVAFSPDNRILASASEDRTVILWNLQENIDRNRIRAEGCRWVGNYLRTNAELEASDRHLCDDIGHPNP